jgi:hypothetical protein
MLDFAARITKGRPMPDGAPTKTAGVVVMSAEDGIDDTIVPRLMAAGADLDRVDILQGIQAEHGIEELVLPDHLDAVRQAVKGVSASLVIVDPCTAYLTSTANSWRDHDVRRALRPLAAFAEEAGVAVISSRHMTKAEGGKATYRGGGSIAFTAMARAEFLVAEDPDDGQRRVFACIKANLAPKQPSLTYRLETTEGGVAKVVWGGTSQYTADDLVASMGDPSEKSALDHAKEFLRDELEDGPQPVTKVKGAAREAGIAHRTLDRARSALGVRAKRAGFGKGGAWVLELPPKAVNINNLASYDDNEAVTHDNTTTSHSAPSGRDAWQSMKDEEQKYLDDERAGIQSETP